MTVTAPLFCRKEIPNERRYTVSVVANGKDYRAALGNAVRDAGDYTDARKQEQSTYTEELKRDLERFEVLEHWPLPSYGELLYSVN